MPNLTLNIDGMTCQNCVRHAREALEGVAGVQKVEVDLETKRGVVEHDGTTDPEALVAALAEEGYPARVL